jgi:uncharacterized protein (DUF433 family)
MARSWFGVGIYTQPEAARLLRMTPSRLRRWAKGYAYWLHRDEQDIRRSQPPVVRETDLPLVRGTGAVSFLELMELRVIRALVDEHNVPLQTIRRVARLAQDEFGTRYPFASRNIYVEGRRIFAAVSRQPDDTDVIELRRGRTSQVHWARILEPMMKEIDFDPATSLAHRWWPLEPNRGVVLDPDIMFGAPVITGSRVRTIIAAGMAEVESVRGTASAFRVSPHGVEAAIAFERFLAAA